MLSKYLKLIKRPLSLAIAVLLGVSLALPGGVVTAAARDDGATSVSIVINVSLRHNVNHLRDQTFSYRIRMTQGGASEIVEFNGRDIVEIDLDRPSGSTTWTGTVTIPDLPVDATFNVSQLRQDLTGRYETDSTRSTRVTDGVRVITFRFTNTPIASGLRSHQECDCWVYEDCEHHRRWDDLFDDNPGSSQRVPSISTMLDDAGRTVRNAPVPSAAISQMETTARGASGRQAAIVVRNATHITPSMLQSLHHAAARHGRTAMVHCDTLDPDGNAVQGRLFLEPGRLLARGSNLQLGVFTESKWTQPIRDLFRRHFTNNVAVVSMEQQGQLGARMRVAAMVDVSHLDAGRLIFHSYNRTTGRYTIIQNPEYSIDTRGFLHFYTSLGGDIVITDFPLTRN